MYAERDLGGLDGPAKANRSPWFTDEITTSATLETSEVYIQRQSVGRPGSAPNLLGLNGSFRFVATMDLPQRVRLSVGQSENHERQSAKEPASRRRKRHEARDLHERLDRPENVEPHDERDEPLRPPAREGRAKGKPSDERSEHEQTQSEGDELGARTPGEGRKRTGRNGKDERAHARKDGVGTKEATKETFRMRHGLLAGR